MNEAHHRDWRCTQCGRKLGDVTDGRLRLRIARRYQYRTALPASCVCPNPRCNTLNEHPGGGFSSDEDAAVGS